MCWILLRYARPCTPPARQRLTAALLHRGGRWSNNRRQLAAGPDRWTNLLPDPEGWARPFVVLRHDPVAPVHGH